MDIYVEITKCRWYLEFEDQCSHSLSQLNEIFVPVVKKQVFQASTKIISSSLVLAMA